MSSKTPPPPRLGVCSGPVSSSSSPPGMRAPWPPWPPGSPPRATARGGGAVLGAEQPAALRLDLLQLRLRHEVHGTEHGLRGGHHLVRVGLRHRREHRRRVAASTSSRSYTRSGASTRIRDAAVVRRRDGDDVRAGRRGGSSPAQWTRAGTAIERTTRALDEVGEGQGPSWWRFHTSGVRRSLRSAITRPAPACARSPRFSLGFPIKVFQQK